MSDSFVINLEDIKRRAREHMAEGAVTSAYGADRNVVIEMLNDALATELVCNLRYRNNYFVAHGIHAEAVANELLEHANEEQTHADRIADRITQLGGEPDFNPATLLSRSHADYTTSQSLQALVRENLVAERVAVATYLEMVRWLGDKDPTTRRLIEEILAQEEEHAEDLSSLLSNTHE